jgi:O-antigen/teichoic acid export membrane protein
LALGFVVTPYLIRTLGNDSYGAYRAALDLVGYLTLFELGIGGALRPVLAASLGKPEDRARAALSAGFRACGTVCAAMLAGGLVLVALAPSLIRGGDVAPGQIRAAVALGVLVSLLALIEPLRALLEARQRGYALHLYHFANSVGTFAAAVVFARLGLGVVGQMGSTLVGALLLILLVSWDAWRGSDSALVASALRTKPDAEARAALRRMNWPILALNMGGRLGLFSDSLIVAAFIGPARVVPLFVTQRLPQLTQTILSQVGNSSWAALAELHYSGQHEAFRRRLIEITRFISILGTAGAVAILAGNHGFVSLWVGAARYGGDALTLVALANALLQGLYSFWGWCFTAVGRVSRVVVQSVAATSINVLGSLWFTSSHGGLGSHRLMGPLLGTLLSFVAVNSWLFPSLMKREFGIRARELWAPPVMAAALGAPVALAARWLDSRWAHRGWLWLAVEMALSGAAYLGLAWFALLSRQERQLWGARGRAMLARLSGRSRASAPRP